MIPCTGLLATHTQKHKKREDKEKTEDTKKRKIVNGLNGLYFNLVSCLKAL